MVEGSIAAYVQWMRLRELSGATIRIRVHILTRLAAHAGKPLAELTRADLDAWQETIDHLAPASRSRYVSIVTCFYRWLQTEGRIEADPSRWLVSPKVPRRMPRPISEPDLELALAAADQRVRCWLTLAAYAGLRGQEIAALERGDVYDSAVPPVLVVRGKGGKERIVPAAPSVLAALRPYLTVSGPLFRRADGRPADAATVRTPCNRLLHSLGIGETLHRLRARFASNLYRVSGNNLRLTQDMLGHSSPTTTAIYVAWSAPEAAAAVAALDHRSTA